MTQRQWIYASRPVGAVSSDHYELREQPLPDMPADHALVKTVAWSVDPYMRIQQSARRTWEEAHPLGTVQGGGTVGVVLQSNIADLPVGAHVSAYKGWQTHYLVAAGEYKVIPRDHADHVSLFLGALGMPGRTAYVGIEVLKPVAGQTLLVSGAAGAVGSLVLQLGRVHGCRVVGIAGGTRKCEYLTSLGADATVDYKLHSNPGELAAAIAAACPAGVDMYFDNVGGVTTDAVVELMNTHGRVVIWYGACTDVCLPCIGLPSQCTAHC